MKPILNRVTLTGADDSIRPEELVEISKDFPFVEWGILLSKSSTGRNRFPSFEWLEKLREFQFDLVLSGHLCGRWVRDVCEGDWSFAKEHPELLDMFDRIQLNFHSYLHKIEEEPFVKGLLEVQEKGRTFIFQLDDVNNELLKVAIKSGVNASGLFDLSGGAGVLPGEWPKQPNQTYCGYAGGLSPDNLQEQLKVIATRVSDLPVWIDAETHVRSTDDQLFDLKKCVKFLEVAKPWVA